MWIVGCRCDYTAATLQADTKTSLTRNQDTGAIGGNVRKVSNNLILDCGVDIVLREELSPESDVFARW